MQITPKTFKTATFLDGHHRQLRQTIGKLIVVKHVRIKEKKKERFAARCSNRKFEKGKRHLAADLTLFFFLTWKINQTQKETERKRSYIKLP